MPGNVYEPLGLEDIAGFGSASTLTTADVQAIRREAPAVGSVSYLIRQSGQIQYLNRNWTTTIQGVSANYPPVTNWRIAEGRGIAGEDVRSSDAVAEVNRVLIRRHDIRPGQSSDFSIRNLSQIAETAEGSSQTMSMLLAAVASISLLVGGIGIMNILLVSVTKRTREIGLRMAIGARRIHVLLQFLAEAVFLSVSGGIAGILTGVVFSLSLPALTGWPAPLSISAAVGGFAFSAAVGIFFGYYPARKAARLSRALPLPFRPTKLPAGEAGSLWGGRLA
ncbi:ABC transporter permease [Bradyrhizobium sp. 41S5]|uniref:ABC transporter permease n=1 Tax=Bradyrhizobium sp. 41S5 TaxID=1404443 RepID=UPI001E4FBE60|nr:ABC transporter permease [Bradyrhizobium sp. 41S5]UFX44483.1 ABC transporter permease [Bradyrhizobium sp. 41S5]